MIKMQSLYSVFARRLRAGVALRALVTASTSVAGRAVGMISPSHAQAPNLGTATSFGVLAGSTVTNTGPSVINGQKLVMVGEMARSTGTVQSNQAPSRRRPE